MTYDIKLCPKCKNLPDIHLGGREQKQPRAVISCCCFSVDIKSDTKEKALRTAVGGWNLGCEAFANNTDK